MSQQEQPPQSRPTGSPPCTMLRGADRQAAALGTEGTDYSQMNGATTLDAAGTSTSAQAVLFSAGGVPRPNVSVAWPILSGVVMDLTSTISTTLGSASGTPSAGTTSNDASHDRDIPPVTAPHYPTRTALAGIECFQRRSEASILLRRGDDDPSSYGPEGPPSPPPPPPMAQPPPAPPPPLPESSCSSSIPTSTSTSSSSEPFDEGPSLTPALTWVHCTAITALAFAACHAIHWMLSIARRTIAIVLCGNDVGSDSPPVTDSGGSYASTGMGLSFKSLIVKWWRDLVIDCARFVVGLRRKEKKIDDSESGSESKICS